MKNQRTNYYYVLLGLFMLSGMSLRLWHWSSQLFLDDEWHAFNFVMDRSFREVVFQHGMGANSIPVNIWFWLTLHTIGWSEIILRLPSMVAGIMAMIILPLLVKRLWGTTVSLIFAALLAVSPIVIFYSRVDRPFSPAMLFGTASFLLTLLWIRDGHRREILISVIAGFIGIYYHLYTAIPVGFPLIITAIAAFKPLSKHFGIGVHSKKPWPILWSAAGIMLGLLGVFVVTPNVLDPWWMGVQGMSRANWGTFITFTEFIVGTARYNLSLAAFVLIPLGSILLIIRNRTQGITFITPLIVFFAVIANYTQDGAHAGIQAARYGIVIFPLCFIAIAIALEWCVITIAKTVPAIQTRLILPVCLVALWLPFLLTSPLWSIYHSPNNFTNHSGFQYHYTPINWERSPERDLVPGVSIGYNEIPSLYRTPEIYSHYKGIIEYSVAIGDHVNPLFYYQHFHKLPVVAGFTRWDRSPRFPFRGAWTFADTTIDYVMSGLPQHLVHKMSWNTMIDLEDMSRLKAKYSGWLLVLHKNPIREMQGHIPEYGNFNGSPDLPLTDQVSYLLNSNFGVPVQANNHISAWVVR